MFVSATSNLQRCYRRVKRTLAGQTISARERGSESFVVIRSGQDIQYGHQLSSTQSPHDAPGQSFTGNGGRTLLSKMRPFGRESHPDPSSACLGGLTAPGICQQSYVHAQGAVRCNHPVGALAKPSAADEAPQAPNVIIFGESGVGKSSLVNMLSEGAVEPAAVSNQALGCTFETQRYNVTLGDREYILWDTAGLNEGSKGTVSEEKACEKLVELLQQLKGGVNLLVYVLRGNRFRGIVRINYEIFQRVVCQRKVPIVLVVTGLENESPMETWWEENKEDLEANGLHFAGHACVTTTKGKRMKSGERVFEEEYAQNWKMKTGRISVASTRAVARGIMGASWNISVADNTRGGVGVTFGVTCDNGVLTR